MGFNAPKLNYGSATEMFDKMNGDAGENVGGIFGFIRKNETAKAALAVGDYVAFAAEYNGAKEATAYGGYIADAVAAFEAVEAAHLAASA